MGQQLYGHGGCASPQPLTNGAHPALYYHQQHLQQQQQPYQHRHPQQAQQAMAYLQAQQHATLLTSALGGAHCSSPPAVASPVSEGRQLRHGPGYQQHQAQRHSQQHESAVAAQQHGGWGAEGYHGSGGYSGGHAHRQHPGYHQPPHQWHSTSAPTSRCHSLGASPVARKPLMTPQHVPSSLRAQAAEPLQLQVGTGFGPISEAQWVCWASLQEHAVSRESTLVCSKLLDAVLCVFMPSPLW